MTGTKFLNEKCSLHQNLRRNFKTKEEDEMWVKVKVWLIKAYKGIIKKSPTQSLTSRKASLSKNT